MSEPTPGPWKAIPPGHGHPTDCLCVQIGEDEMYTTLEVLPADAHLMAAAPDLRDACEAYREAATVLVNELVPVLQAHGLTLPQPVAAAFNRARKLAVPALAKSRGETP